MPRETEVAWVRLSNTSPVLAAGRKADAGPATELPEDATRASTRSSTISAAGIRGKGRVSVLVSVKFTKGGRPKVFF
jgi:hypothetical protein